MTKTNSQTANNNQSNTNFNILKNFRSASNDRSTKHQESSYTKLFDVFENNDKLRHLNLINNINQQRQQLAKNNNNNNLFKSNPSSLSSNSLSGNSLQFDNNNNNNFKIDNQANFEHKSRMNEKENTNLNINSQRERSSSKIALNKNCNSIELNNNNNNNKDSVKYGELILLGYNGCINNHPSSSLLINDNKSNLNSNLLNNINNFNSTRRKSKFILKARDKPNGVKPATQHNCQSSFEVNNLMSKNNHSVTYTLSRHHTVVVQYIRDEKTDMFQIGRSSESAIDFIVLDTVVPQITPNTTPNSSLPQSSNGSSNGNSNNNSNNNNNPQSTISRFSCRIVVEREYPYTARIYAAGFDSSKRIFLGEKATKWKNEKGELDGVTTNGVLIMHPSDGFTNGPNKTNEWMEVSVCGAVFSLNESRLTPCLVNIANSKHQDLNKSNILRDGTLIDLCGATLLWRSTDSLQNTPTKHYIEMNLEHLNKIKPQCPVGLKTLVFPSTASPLAHKQFQPSILFNSNNNNERNNHHLHHYSTRTPMVYLKCGHVHGQHDWGVKKDNERECPLCRKVGPYVQLLIGLEPSFYCDTDIKANTFFKAYAFRPCGHMASEETCKYWSKIMLPQGTSQSLTSVCPFCAIPLCKEQPYVKLIFQEGL